eukprot:RCo006299
MARISTTSCIADLPNSPLELLPHCCIAGSRASCSGEFVRDPLSPGMGGVPVRGLPEGFSSSSVPLADIEEGKAASGTEGRQDSGEAAVDAPDTITELEELLRARLS